MRKKKHHCQLLSPLRMANSKFLDEMRGGTQILQSNPVSLPLLQADQGVNNSSYLGIFNSLHEKIYKTV